jgi:hypothetical protein
VRVAQSVVEDLGTRGYAIVRGVFDAAAVRRLADCFERVSALAEAGGLPADVRVFLSRTGSGVLRLAQRFGHYDADTLRIITDPRLAAILVPLLGADARVVVTSFFCKPPHADDDHVGYHQDASFRKPRAAFRDLASGYLQVGIAVDGHRPDNGGLRIVRGSHHSGDLDLTPDGGVSCTPMSDEVLWRVGLDPGDVVTLDLEPGDVGIWRGYAVHGSPPNTSGAPRRMLTCGVASAACTELGDSLFGS